MVRATPCHWWSKGTHDDDKPILCLKNTARGQTHMVGTTPGRNELTTRGAMRLDRKVVGMDIVHRAATLSIILAFVCPLAVQQRTRNRAKGMHSCTHIANRSLGHGRRTGRVPQ